MLPVIVYPDVELWATGYLRTALAARGSQAKVSNAVPTTMPTEMVAVRRDGGPVLPGAREAARLGVNVWAGSEQAVAALAALVQALLLASPDGSPVLRATSLSGPSPIADPSGKPRRFLTVELTVRGTQS